MYSLICYGQSIYSEKPSGIIIDKKTESVTAKTDLFSCFQRCNTLKVFVDNMT